MTETQQYIDELLSEAEDIDRLSPAAILTALLRESRTAQHDGARIRALELLGRAKRMFVDRVETENGDILGNLEAIRRDFGEDIARAYAERLGIDLPDPPH